MGEPDAPPIREAIVLAAPGDLPPPVARVPPLVRTILALQRGGVERCTLVGAPPPANDARIRCRVDAAPALTPSPDDALRIVVGPGAVIDPALVRDLQARARPGEVLELEEDGARVRVAPGPLVAGNGGRAMRPRVGTLRRAGSPDVVQSLLRALENPRDGYLDRLVHRRLSRPVSRLLLGTPISANAVTVIGVALGVAGGIVLALPGAAAVAGAVLLLVASGVLDCSDGELARIRCAESRLGHWLDVAGDTLVHLAVLGGIAVRIARAGAAPGRVALGALLVGVLGAFAAITWSEETEARRHRVDVWENRVLDGVLSPLTTRDWHVFPLLFAVAGRLDLLVPGAAAGANVFWPATLLLVRRVLRQVQGSDARVRQ